MRSDKKEYKKPQFSINIHIADVIASSGDVMLGDVDVFINNI